MANRYDDGLDDFDRDLLGQPPLPPEPFLTGRRGSNYFPTPTLPHASTPFDGHTPIHEAPLLPSPYLAPGFSRGPLSSHDAHGITGRQTVLSQSQADPFLEGHTLASQGPRLTRPATFAQQYERNSQIGTSAQSNIEPADGSSPAARISSRKQRGFQPSQKFSKHSSSPSLRSTPTQNPLPQSASSTPIVHGIPLISLRDALPERFRSIFPYELFNAVQSKCFPIIYNTNDNVVIAAPTGSGKTAILELAICKLALNRGNENFKIVYQAPTKALCAEKARDWEQKFSHMNLKCAELTGDTSQAEMRRVGDASIIVTTPEKWDSITRKWQDHRRLLQLVELFLIDEVHILKDARGATLEAVVSRMKTIGANVRFIALSATVPNSDDIAVWLGRNHTTQHLPAHREAFGEQFRPVKLQKFVYGFDSNSNDFMFDKYLDQKLPGLITKHAKQKPILIFCFTRKSCESTAAVLAEFASGRTSGDKLWPLPSQPLVVVNRDLQELVRFGVAFHHAGLDVQDRTAIEQAFLSGQLGLICCTSTLAVGINLPCHTVILKGTVCFNNERLEEYSNLEVMQMLGRAGRPQFDDSATAIILTRASRKDRYQKMVSGQEILESRLHLNLIEHLNSEVCLGTIRDRSSASTWLGGTFLSVRLRRNPGYYRLAGSEKSALLADAILEEICDRDITQLQEAELVTSGETFQSTEYGKAMSKYMVEFSTMKLLLQIPRGVGMEALITILSQASEFKEFRLKPAERALFREINQSPLIMYPVKEQVTETRHKISLMVQSLLGCVQFPTTGDAGKLRRQLVMERKLVQERLNRLVRAVVDCKGYDRDSIGTKTALDLARALAAESWEGRPTQLTQVPNIGPVGMRKLASRDIRTILQLADKEPEEIERLMSRQPPFGKQLKTQLDRFPRLGVEASITRHRVYGASEEPVLLEMKAILRYLNDKGPPHWRNRPPALNFLVETSSGTLAYFWRGSMKKLESPGGLELKFSVGLREHKEQVVCHFTCEEIVGTIVSTTLEHRLSPSMFPARPIRKESPVPKQPTQKPRRDIQELVDDDDIEDSDLILAADQAAAIRSTTAQVAQTPVESEDVDEYPSVDELIDMDNVEAEQADRFDNYLTGHEDDMEPIETPEPVRLPNGKWQCNHPCSGGALTRSGNPCNHKCCKEGLDKPRKRAPPKRKRDEETDRPRGHGAANRPQQGTAQAPASAKKQKVQTTLDLVTVKPGTQPKQPVKAASSNLNTGKLDLDDLECIDLAFSDDDDAWSMTLDAAPRQSPTKGRQCGNSGVTDRAVSPACQTKSALRSNPGSEKPTSSSLAASQYQDNDWNDEDLEVLDWPHSSRVKALQNNSETTLNKVVCDHALGGAGTTESVPSGSEKNSDLTLASEDASILGSGTTPHSTDARHLPVSPQQEGRQTHRETGDAEAASKKEEEPAWVAEFDPEFVDMFRGYVTFV
ncbi:hypothetical protein VTJ49DRAFT_491 [Mycothermus thermophilus]|uniref:DNA 3'-5' helicase n=1 Tax=Humicola insolens TaxID=85995 RepID=A0ABR3VF38_HUMIN